MTATIIMYFTIGFAVSLVALFLLIYRKHIIGLRSNYPHILIGIFCIFLITLFWPIYIITVLTDRNYRDENIALVCSFISVCKEKINLG